MKEVFSEIKMHPITDRGTAFLLTVILNIEGVWPAAINVGFFKTRNPTV